MRIYKQTLIVLATLITLCIPSLCQAHPHAFTESAITFIMRDGQLKGIEQKWKFDSMFTMFMLEEFDENRDGKISTTERARIEKESFGTLYDFGYFTYINVNEEFIKAPKGEDFQVKLEGDQMLYSFFLPLEVKAPATVMVSVFDESYYTDIIIEAFANIKESESKSIELKIADAPEFAYYAGMIIPRKATLKLK